MEKIIVSFTSYPKRIATVHKVLDSIMKQTILPDKIILYLSSSEFEDFEAMPDFQEYEKHGFEIHWVEENIKSHKKWFYAFQEYPNDIIITIDDDILYRNTALENLLKYHNRFPKAVIARRTHLITCKQDGSIALYDDWYGECGIYLGMPRMDLVATGNGGILYPPHVFAEELYNKDIFLNCCQYADDLWLKIMEIYNGIPTVLAEELWDDPVLEEHQVNCLFEDYNDNGGNDRQLEALLKHYIHTSDGNQLLIDNIFLNGRMLSSEVNKMKKQQMEKIHDELIEKMQTCGEILIYGAGLLGNQIYNFMKNNNIDIVKAFIVNDIKNNPRLIDNIPIKDYREFVNGDEKIVIALYNKSEAELVRATLIKEGTKSDRIILLHSLEKQILSEKYKVPFESRKYWEKRYSEGGNSGSGSYNRLADFKAKIINEFVKENAINEVVEWGCGDGNQLSLAQYPYYIGYDVSQKAIEICKLIFSADDTKKFIWCGLDEFESDVVGDLALSLDVIFHLIEDEVFEKYMQRLFSSSNKYVCIYSSNYDEVTAEHVKHRKFTEWIEKNLNNEWKLEKFIKNRFPYLEEDCENTSFSDFYFYKKIITE